MKTTPVTDSYFKESLMKNKGTQPLHHENDIKSIQDNTEHVFRLLLKLQTIAEEEEEVTVEGLNSRSEDTSSL